MPTASPSQNSPSPPREQGWGQASGILCGCANRSQGSRGVRTGASGVPPQGPGARARARDAPASPLRAARGSSQDQEPPRPAAPNPLAISPPHAVGRSAPPEGRCRVGISPPHHVGRSPRRVAARRVGSRTTQVRIIPMFGDHGGGETPVPIPNTVVKPSSADGTVGVTRWESRSLPSILISPATRKGGGTYLFLPSPLRGEGQGVGR